MVGKLIPDFFPKIFGPRRTSARRRRGARRRSPRSRQEVGAAAGGSRRRLHPIAVENMANAIKKISVQRGYDVTRYALNCFGGAGGQHACLVADALGMTQGADPSVLVAAVGLWHGARRHPRHAPAGDRRGAARAPHATRTRCAAGIAKTRRAKAEVPRRAAADDRVRARAYPYAAPIRTGGRRCDGTDLASDAAKEARSRTGRARSATPHAARKRSRRGGRAAWLRSRMMSAFERAHKAASASSIAPRSS